MNELISILIPVWNEEETVSNCIQSCLNQTYKNFEIIIVDNKSTDKTVQIINSFSDKRIKLFLNDTNVGVLKNHELALNYASGDLVLFVGADDIIYSNCLEILYSSNISKNFIGVCGQIDDIYENGNIIKIPNRCRTGRISLGSHLWRPNPFYFFSLFQREVVMNAIPFESLELKYGLGADLIFLAKILAKGDILIIDQSVYAYRFKDRSKYNIGSNKIFNKMYRLWKNLFYLKKIYFINFKLVKNPIIQIKYYLFAILGFIKNNFL